MSPDLHHLSGAYAVDALDRAERESFEHHLSVCDACRAEVAELSDAAHSLAVLGEATPPASLRTSVLAGIAQVRPLPPLVTDSSLVSAADDPSTPVAPVVPLFRRASTWLAAAAAAAAIAVGGIAWSPWSGDAPTLSAVQQVERADDAATVTSHKGAVTATLAYSRRLDRSAITVAGMPPAPDGKTYQLWYVGSDEVARSAGFLTAGADGHGEAVLEGGIDGASAVGVTVEPTGGSQAPTTDPIMVMAVA
ncbi:anti-sigma factor [Phycicoccus sonneratiae]|uniref:Regulator of SigK n=1 Tax=Phycicoccus sonneratiae TaxID=2807628 RepID=A0ABS2CTU9_9MICO|nr:anti-sigma factor [Phycicoccus sonneraticus]MBM6402519.1 anti-sigma factor [Phycicoccus sonneraticus]